MHTKFSVVSLFLELVSIDSPSGEENRVAKYICSFCRKFGISVHTDKFGNVIASIPGKGSPFILTAHMDTVEPGRCIKPILSKGIIKSSGNTILGADNKAGLAAILFGVSSMNLNRSNRRSVELIFTTSEESGNYGALNVQLSSIYATYGFSFDAGGKLGTIFTSSPYYNRFDVTVTGKSAHASQPEKAVNALTIASKAIASLPFGRVDKKTICNIGLIQGGSARNTVPGSVSLAGEVRSFSERLLDKATRTISDQFKYESKQYKGKVTINTVRENPGYSITSNNPNLKLLQNAFTRAGIPWSLSETYACFDANIFNNREISIINACDGSLNNHTTNEQISVANLEKLSNVIQNLIGI
jgi:tripeptide aminopeptidase